MELVLLFASTILSLQVRFTLAIPIPLSAANCNFPTPVLPSIGGQIHSCTSAELERQRQADYDAEARKWLKDAGVVPLKPTPTDSVPNYPNSPSTTPSTAKSIALASSATSSSSLDDSSQRGRLPSLIELFTNGAARSPNSRTHLPSSIEEQMPDDIEISLFDLPSAHQSSRSRPSSGRNGKQAIGTAPQSIGHHARKTHATVTQLVMVVFLFVALGLMFAVGFALRTGQLLFNAGWSHTSTKSQPRLRRGFGKDNGIDGAIYRRVRSSLEVFGCRDEEAVAVEDDRGESTLFHHAGGTCAEKMAMT